MSKVFFRIDEILSLIHIFRIRQDGREAFSFNELSDGYSSVIYIVSDLILRMDKNWLLDNEMCIRDSP